MQKCEHKFYIGVRNQVGRYGLYSGHYPEVFVAPENAQNAETKCWSGAVPILLLALLALMTSAYSSLGVLQGLNPRRQLLKASVYHLATSAGSVMMWVSVKPYAHPQLEKVLKPLICVSHGYGMQFEMFYSLNQSIVAWFAHLHQVGFQPALRTLGKCLGW